ncbi:hypothetical protein Q1695_007361 [Nippostrongylus brasiliensis]|nr:hypothetical protein Q1695_007361 [Nippostrongylus brasiliensis]
MPDDNIVCFQTAGKPLLVKAGNSQHWIVNMSSLKLNYKISFENPDSSFSINPSQLSGEIAERGQILLDFTRKVIH